ncbi:hypothetical protein WJX74_002689 [Apatococcus lobatus]|uniref:DCD domain-containing protein n=1 Tax=Apatococcus lobatus TaxID=904363 RepID=A0AAW1QLY0_9CHLO
MTLFLFNTSTRRLHGIFEAVSAGGLDLNPAAWPTDGCHCGSRYPAQVWVKIVDACPPLAEKIFQPLIEDSYVDNVEFQLELSQAEAAAITTLMRHECGLEMGFTSGFDTRGLDPKELGGVIFTCTKGTVTKCIVSRLFGLPRQHYGYVRHIHKGMRILLFHAGTRMLHGPFQAVEPGGWNMDPKAFAPPTAKDGGSRFPAQVRVEATSPTFCIPETKFKPVIQAAYFSSKEFHFELTHGEAAELTRLLGEATEAAAEHAAKAVSAHDPTPSNGPQPTSPHRSTAECRGQPRKAEGQRRQDVADGRGSAAAAVNDRGAAEPAVSRKAGAAAHKAERAARRAARAAVRSAKAAGAPPKHASRPAKHSSQASGLSTIAADAPAAALHVIDLEDLDPGPVASAHASLQSAPVPPAAAAAAPIRGKGNNNGGKESASGVSLRSKLDAIFAEAAQPAPSLPSRRRTLPAGSSLPDGPIALPPDGEMQRLGAQVARKDGRSNQSWADSPAVSRPKSAREIVAEQAQAAMGSSAVGYPETSSPQAGHQSGAPRQTSVRLSRWSMEQQGHGVTAAQAVHAGPCLPVCTGGLDSFAAAGFQCQPAQPSHGVLKCVEDGGPASGSLERLQVPCVAQASARVGNAEGHDGHSRSSAETTAPVHHQAADWVHVHPAATTVPPAVVVASPVRRPAMPAHGVPPSGSSTARLAGDPARLQMLQAADAGGPASPNVHPSQAPLDLLQELELLEGRLKGCKGEPNSPQAGAASAMLHQQLAQGTEQVPSSGPTADGQLTRGSGRPGASFLLRHPGNPIAANRQQTQPAHCTAADGCRVYSSLRKEAMTQQPLALPGPCALPGQGPASSAAVIIDLTSNGAPTLFACKGSGIAEAHGDDALHQRPPDLHVMHNGDLSGSAAPPSLPASQPAPSPPDTISDSNAARESRQQPQGGKPSRPIPVHRQDALADASPCSQYRAAGVTSALQPEAHDRGKTAGEVSLQTQRSPGSRRLMISLSSDEDHPSPPAKRQRTDRDEMATAAHANRLQPICHSTPSKGVEGGQVAPIHAEPQELASQPHNVQARQRAPDLVDQNLGSPSTGHSRPAAGVDKAGHCLPAAWPPSHRPNKPVWALPEGQGQSTPHLHGMLPRTATASTLGQAAGSPGGAHQPQAACPQLAHQPHPQVCSSQGAIQDSMQVGVLGLGSQALDWVHQEARHLQPQDLLAAAKQLQGLADEYTGELQAVQRAMVCVLTLLSKPLGPSLVPTSTFPAQHSQAAASPQSPQLPAQNGLARKHKRTSEKELKRRSNETLSKRELRGACGQGSLGEALRPSGNADVQSRVECNAQADMVPPTRGDGLISCPVKLMSTRATLQAGTHCSPLLSRDGANLGCPDVPSLQSDILLPRPQHVIPQPAPVAGIHDLQEHQAGSALSGQHAAAPGSSGSPQQGRAEQLSLANTPPHDGQHLKSRPDALQHAWGTELRQALHIGLNQEAQTAAQTVAQGNDWGVLQADNSLALHEDSQNGAPGGSQGIVCASKSPAYDAQLQKRQPRGTCIEPMAARDSNHQPVWPSCTGIFAAEGALEMDVDCRRAKAGVDPRPVTGKKGKKQVKLGLPPTNLKKEKQRRKREREAQAARPSEAAAHVLIPGSTEAKLSKAERKAKLGLQQQQQHQRQARKVQGQSAICFEKQGQHPQTCREEACLSGPENERQPRVALEGIDQPASKDEQQCRNADDLVGTRLPPGCIMLVLDTNIYLNERPRVYQMIHQWQLLLQAFLPHAAVLLIPRAVIRELSAFKQRQKGIERPDLAGKASSSLQLLTSIVTHPAVHLQMPAERYLPAADSIAKHRYDYERNGDDGILDCMRYFQSLGHDVRLVSQDSAFNVRAAVGNQIIVYNPRQMHDLVESLTKPPEEMARS